MTTQLNKQPLRIGTLGASRIATAVLIHPAKRNQQVEIVAFADLVKLPALPLSKTHFLIAARQ